MRWLTFPGIALAAAFIAPLPAHAQVDSREAIVLQNQIYQLRQEMLQIQDRGGSSAPRGGYQQAPSNELVAQLLNRVEGLEEQVRQLRGRMDEGQFQSQRLIADLNKKIDDLAFQVGNPPSAPAAGTPVLTPPPFRPNAPPPLASPPLASPPLASAPTGGPALRGQPRTPDVAMQQGSAALARRDYPVAEQAAREVLANRTSPRAYDAQLLLAQALSGQRQFPQAAIAYDDTYNRSRKGVHGPDALLGLANSLAAINEKKAACDTLARMHAEFPQLRPDLRESSAGAAQRAGCR